MPLDTLNHDVHVNGTLSAKTVSLPAGCVGNAAIAAGAGIDASKQEHQHEKTYAQASGSVSATERKVIHVVYGATATILAFRAGSKTACAGAATITVDLLKNGVSILTAVITLDNANTAYIVESAAVLTPGLVAGDVLEVNITATAGGGTIGNGVFAQVVLEEDAQ